MRKTMTLIVCLLLAPLSLGADDTGCQSESASVVDQERIYTSYWVLYDVTTNTTYARAQFRLGSAVGTTLILDGPSSVSFNGNPMGFNELLDWHEVALPGRVDAGTFVFIDNDGAEFANDMMAMPETEIPAAFPSVVDGRDSLLIEWDGAPIADDDLLSVIAAHDANRFDFARFDTRAIGGTSIVLDAGGLSTLARGPAVISIHRHVDHELQQSTAAGGKLTMTYQSTEVPFTLQ